MEYFSHLLWDTQGITETNSAGLTLRTVPCSGATHSFETYLFIMGVEGVQKGVYRYLHLEHELLFMLELNSLITTLLINSLKVSFYSCFL